MNAGDLDTNAEARRRRLTSLRNGVSIPTAGTRAFGYFALDMFECPPFFMFSNNDVPVLEYILDQGTFEAGSMALWCRLAKTATGFLDIGANVGIYSLAAAKLRPELSVHAYEPNPYAYARLRVHKHLNDLQNIIEHPVAIYNRLGVSILTWEQKPYGNISSGAALGSPTQAGVDSVAVRVERIDETGLAGTLGKQPLIKIDVEGAEVNVLGGMKEVLDLRPDIILETFKQDACEAINALVLPMGYSIYSIHEDTRELRRKPRLTPCNAGDGSHDFNQFLTVRPESEIATIMAVA